MFFFDNDKIAQHRVNRHGAGHCNAIGIGQRIGRAEGDHQKFNTNEQEEIDVIDIDLPHLLRGGVFHFQAWNIAQLHGLIGERKCA